MVYLWLKMVLLNPIVYYLSGIGETVRSFKQLWSGRPMRKPPYRPLPRKLRKTRLRHPLLCALALMAQTPVMARSSELQRFDEIGLNAFEDLPNLSPKQAGAVRDLLQTSTNTEFQ